MNRTAKFLSIVAGLYFAGGVSTTAQADDIEVFVNQLCSSLEETLGGAEAVSDHLHLPVHWVKDDDGTYPLCGDYVERFVHENSPYCNAFAALKHRLYRTARQRGCRLMMVGDCGDLLYGAREYWLRDLITRGQLGTFVHSAAATVNRAWRGDTNARRALRRLLPIRGLRDAIRRPRLPWLTPAARNFLSVSSFSPIVPQGRHRYRYDAGIGTRHTEIDSEERRLFAQCKIGRSNPFWHWPLLEATLNLPAYWYQQDGRSKVLAREAMKDRLPDRVLASPRVGLLGWFFLRGIELNRDQIRATVFQRPRSDWQRYVNRAWVEPYLHATGKIAFGHTILWRVISYEHWYRRLIRQG